MAVEPWARLLAHILPTDSATEPTIITVRLPDGDTSGSKSMVTVNRTGIVVKPGQRFLEWLHQADTSSANLKLEDLRLEPTIYLLPECESENEAREHLEILCSDVGSRPASCCNHV